MNVFLIWLSNLLTMIKLVYFLLSKNFYLIWLSNYLTMSVPE